MRQYSGRRRDLIRLWCGILIAAMSMSRLFGTLGYKVVGNKYLDGVPRQRGNNRGNTIDASGERGWRHQHSTLGKHEL